MSEFRLVSGAEAPIFSQLSEWDIYAGQDWLYPERSVEAHRHFRGKLEEEQLELREALAAADIDGIAAEGGDVAWCATAIARNAGVTLEEATEGSTINGALTPVDIDQLAESGLQYWDVPGLKAAHNYDDADVNELMRAGDTGTLAAVIAELSHQVCKSTEICRKLQAEGLVGDNQWYYLHESRIKEGVSELLVAVAVAARGAGKSLAEVLQGTYQKLEGRKNDNRPITKLPRSLF
jgi:NTP pyrophosphatase (non-canonical NTP hydrolase)